MLNSLLACIVLRSVVIQINIGEYFPRLVILFSCILNNESNFLSFKWIKRFFLFWSKNSWFWFISSSVCFDLFAHLFWRRFCSFGVDAYCTYAFNTCNCANSVVDLDHAQRTRPIRQWVHTLYETNEKDGKTKWFNVWWKTSWLLSCIWL